MPNNMPKYGRYPKLLFNIPKYGMDIKHNIIYLNMLVIQTFIMYLISNMLYISRIELKIDKSLQISNQTYCRFILSKYSFNRYRSLNSELILNLNKC